MVVAGGGPTGMMLAAELTLGGAGVVVVEARATRELAEPRARGIHARTIEELDQRGVAARFLAAGKTVPMVGFAGAALDTSDLPTRHNYTLALLQPHFERILGTWVDELGVPTLWGRSVTGFDATDDGVEVRLSDGSTLRAQYLVGCDGGRSTVRKAAGIEFPGEAATVSWLMAEVEMEEQPPVGVRPEGGGIGPAETAGRFGVVVREARVGGEIDPTFADLKDELARTYGTDFGAREPAWISRFTDMTRQAASYRIGRVLLAGDAAHVHPPQGGQGLNLGVQDAVNLGWKLARVARGNSPASLLDTYHHERHPVGERVLRNSRAQVALSGAGPGIEAVRAILGELLRLDQPRRQVAAMVSSLDIRYDLGEGHPLVGRRMPDLDLVTPQGATTVFTLLHEARGLLLHFGESAPPELAHWGDRLRFVEASPVATFHLPAVGEVGVPAAVLVRPDGYVAWAGPKADPTLRGVLAKWFGKCDPLIHEPTRGIL